MKRKPSANVKRSLPQQKTRENGSCPRNTISHVNRMRQRLDSISKLWPQAPWGPTNSTKMPPKQQQQEHCESEEEKHLHSLLQHQESPGGERITRRSLTESVWDAREKPTTTEGEATRLRSNPYKSVPHERDTKDVPQEDCQQNPPVT